MFGIDQIKEVLKGLDQHTGGLQQIIKNGEDAIKDMLNKKAGIEVEYNRIKELATTESAKLRDLKASFDKYKEEETAKIRAMIAESDSKINLAQKLAQETRNIKATLDQKATELNSEKDVVAELKADYESKITKIKDFVSTQK